MIRRRDEVKTDGKKITKRCQLIIPCPSIMLTSSNHYPYHRRIQETFMCRLKTVFDPDHSGFQSRPRCSSRVARSQMSREYSSELVAKPMFGRVYSQAVRKSDL